MKNLRLFCMLIMIFLVSSCAKDQLFDPPCQMSGNSSLFNVISPKLKIAVVSDIHYFDPSLMPDDYATNADFQQDMSLDRKLIELSDPIFRKVLEELIAERPDILMISGDLTKDGEMKSHETMRGFLRQLEDAGIDVFVVPGNNDILNSGAVSYKSGSRRPVPNITIDQFREIYDDFGCNEAISRDPNSLSYICQPTSKLWILGIDNCKYTLRPNGTYKVSGAINPGTLIWIQEKMAEARENNITVLAMMHYGILEHYSGQNSLEPLIKDFENNAKDIMNTGIRLMFTGHYHANDIVDFVYDGKTLTDIQTGSLVTPLSPYRIMTLDDNFIKIETRRITSVEADLGEVDFLSYSDMTIDRYLNGFFTFYIPLLFPGADASILAPYFTNAYKAYLEGDEKITPAERKELDDLSVKSPSSAMYYLNSIWTDLQPNDNKIHIKLN